MVLAVFGLALLWTYMLDGQPEAQYSYGQMVEDARQGKIDQITKDGDRLIVKFTSSSQEPATAVIPSELTDVYANLGCAGGGDPGQFSCTKFTAVEPSAAGSIITLLITALLPVLLIGAFIFFMMRQAQGTNNQAMSFGKSRARMFLGNKTVVTFNDVAGVDEAKQELTEVVEFINGTRSIDPVHTEGQPGDSRIASPS